MSVSPGSIRAFRSRDTVIVVINPPTLPFVGAVACVIRRSRFILLIHDVYPEVVVVAGYARSSSVLVRIGNLASRWLYRRAYSIVVLSEDMRLLLSTNAD